MDRKARESRGMPSQADLGESYTVTTIGGCTFVYGQVPVMDMVGLMKRASQGAVMDMGLADRIGATIVFGLREDLDRLPVADLPISPKRLADAAAARAAGLPGAVQHWLAEGERGMSSDAMCKAIWGGVPAGAGDHHPRDVGDLSRCIAMVDATQPGDRIQLAATISPVWAEIVAVWEELRATFGREAAERAGASPKVFAETADLLRTVLERRYPEPAGVHQ